MYKGKYSTVIGYSNPIPLKLRLNSYRNANFIANHSAAFPLVHQNTEFRQAR